MRLRIVRLGIVLPLLLTVLLVAACSRNNFMDPPNRFGLSPLATLGSATESGAPEYIQVNKIVTRSKSTLDWLADHQNEQGHWSGTGYDDDSSREDAERTENIEFRKPGDPDGDIAGDQHETYLTALALLTFVGSGYDHTFGNFRETCRKSLKYLREHQNEDGSFAKDEDGHLRIHATATSALAEIYGISLDDELEVLLKKAVDYLISRQVDDSGWGGNDKPDIITTAQCTYALKSAEMAGTEFDSESVYKGIRAFLEKVKTKRNGQLTVRFSESRSRVPLPKGSKTDKTLPINEAAWIMTAMFAKHRSEGDEDVKALVKLLVEEENLPAWKESKLDFMYWNFGTLALYQAGGDAWKTWAKALSETLLDHQRGVHETDKENGHTSADELAEHGSWDAVDCWSIDYGRAYSTAINAHTLQVYYRYLRLSGFGKDSDDE